LPIQEVADGNSEPLDAVEKAITRDYVTIGGDVPTPEQGGRAR
jgi:hypothetical protein